MTLKEFHIYCVNVDNNLSRKIVENKIYNEFEDLMPEKIIYMENGYASSNKEKHLEKGEYLEEIILSRTNKNQTSIYLQIKKGLDKEFEKRINKKESIISIEKLSKEKELSHKWSKLNPEIFYTTTVFNQFYEYSIKNWRKKNSKTIFKQDSKLFLKVLITSYNIIAGINSIFLVNYFLNQ